MMRTNDELQLEFLTHKNQDMHPATAKTATAEAHISIFHWNSAHIKNVWLFSWEWSTCTSWVVNSQVLSPRSCSLPGFTDPTSASTLQPLHQTPKKVITKQQHMKEGSDWQPRHQFRKWNRTGRRETRPKNKNKAFLNIQKLQKGMKKDISSEQIWLRNLLDWEKNTYFDTFLVDESQLHIQKSEQQQNCICILQTVNSF